jgi:hypothetical protein
VQPFDHLGVVASDEHRQAKRLDPAGGLLVVEQRCTREDAEHSVHRFKYLPADLRGRTCPWANVGDCLLESLVQARGLLILSLPDRVGLSELPLLPGEVKRRLFTEV